MVARTFAALVVLALLAPQRVQAQLPDHLRCFRIKDSAARTRYLADLVPDLPPLAPEPGCTVAVPAKYLCVPADKTNVTPPPPGTSPFAIAQTQLCYKTKCPKRPAALAVEDQFGARPVEVKAGSLLCAPALASGATTPTTSTTTTTMPTVGGVVRFAALGCTGKANAAQFAVAAALEAKCAADGCDFVQLLGNNIYDNGVESPTDEQWDEKFEIPYAGIHLPFFAVLGNHDYGGNGAGYEFGKGQHQIDRTPLSGKWRMPAAHYHRTVGPAEFFALDTNLQMYGMDADQRTAVAGWIAASTAPWRIAVGHHDYRSNGPHGNAGEYDGLPFIPIANGAGVKSFLEDVVCGRVDAYLSAHDHSLQWLEPTCAGTELLVSGTGSSPTGLSGTNPTYFQSLELGFLYVVISGNTLTAEFVGTTGTTLFSRSITKP
jgi:hypothetical protein